MAERVDFDWNSRPDRGRPTKYPWDEWLDGSTWRLRRGEDFDLDDSSLRAAVSSAARKRNKRGRVTCEGDGVYVIQAQEISATAG